MTMKLVSPGEAAANSNDIPAEAGEEKYDESAAAMIAQLRYGSGVPFYRLERLERNLGIPLPAATQWEVIEGGGRVDPAGL